MFYFYWAALGIVTAAAAVTWDRWYIRREIKKEFVRQLRLEADGKVEIIRFQR